MIDQGVEPAAVDTMVENRWADSTDVGLDSAWRQWSHFCASRGFDASVRDNPSAVQVVNFLAAVRAGEFASRKRGETLSAEWVRKVRSAVSIMVSIWGQRNVRIGAHPLVTCYIDSLVNDDYRVQDKRVYRYDDTWDVQLLFDFIRDNPAPVPVDSASAADRALFLRRKRNHLLAVGRVVLANRSSDMACVYRGRRSERTRSLLRASSSSSPPVVLLPA